MRTDSFLVVVLAVSLQLLRILAQEIVEDESGRIIENTSEPSRVEPITEHLDLKPDKHIDMRRPPRLTRPTRRKPSRPPRLESESESIILPNMENSLGRKPELSEDSSSPSPTVSTLVTAPVAAEDGVKIFVNPNNNAINFVKPSPVKPTTEQVEFEPGLPPGWSSSSRPPSRPTRPTRRTKPTRTGRPRISSEASNVTLLEKPAVTDGSSVGSSAVTEEGASSTYPPGVSAPEPTITDKDPDRGVVEWLLGLVGIKPNPDTSDQSNSGGPAKGCSQCECGLTYKHNRIVGGVETQVNEYPWMVILLYSNRFYCGASVINSRYILTAGHCVNGFSKDRLSAVFLDHDRGSNYETTTFTRRISKILRHSSYGVGGSYNHDIALLRLDEELSFKGKVKPVCLPDVRKTYNGHTGVVTGWGATSAHGSVSNKLREVEVPIMSNSDCKKTGYGQRITENMLCAGYTYGTKDSCQGDSGGPLHIKNGTHHTIVGIVSWGEGCAEPNYPGVYTRVSRYIPWITANTKDGCFC